MDDDDWGLHAVVRSCARASSHAAAGDPPPPILRGDPQTFFPDPERRGLPPPLVGRLLLPKQRPLPGAGPRSKRRKSQVKKVVCQVPADGVCADVWAWRKYGQKPIKGSPFPRGYYRCSSSKGCPARKLVERSRADPSSFIVTYTAEHNHAAPAHRSCLAGSTRAKSSPAAPPHSGGDCSSDAGPAAGDGLSPTTPLPAPADAAAALLMRLEEDDEDDDALIDFGCYSC